MEDIVGKKVYIIGIEGAGTSALALMYKNLGYDVSGSDNGDHFYGDVLAHAGIKVFDNYDKKNISRDIFKVVYSTTIKENNLEFMEARRKKIKTFSYPEALAELFNQKTGIAVCGTHGKTTTTAMLAFVLNELDLKPSAIVGSKVIDWQGNSLTGRGDYFVIEADEYQNKLKHYNPWSIILTSLDYDHPDFYKTFVDYKKAFVDFVKKIPQHGFLIYCNDSRDVVEIADGVGCQKMSYGFTEDSDFLIDNLKIKLKKSTKKPQQIFEVLHRNNLLGEFTTQLVGKHNALNATAVITFCHKLGLDMENVKKALADFSGMVRRFEYIGEKNGAILIDDYAHHPEEIKTTLKTVLKIYSDKKIIAIFHPHSFTRTEALLEDFAQSFDDCTKVFVLDIYGSVRENSGKVSSQDLVDKINKYSINKNKAEYIPTIEETINFLQDKIGKDDIIISLGAGDVWRVTHKLAGK